MLTTISAEAALKAYSSDDVFGLASSKQQSNLDLFERHSSEACACIV